MRRLQSDVKQRFSAKTITMACLWLALLALLGVPSGPLAAQTDKPMAGPEFGARIGWDVDNDQFLLGFQAALDQVVKPFTLAPSFDYGTGGDLTTYTFNADLRVDLFSPPGSITGVYIGAGPTIAVWKPSGFANDTEIGLTAVGGLKVRLGQSSRYNIEARVGIGDVPDTRLMLGVLF